MGFGRGGWILGVLDSIEDVGWTDDLDKDSESVYTDERKREEQTGR